MANTLVSPTDLVGFPGAPFDDYLLDVAAASVRAEAGWHIAPVLSETITVSSWGGHEIYLPSRRVVGVTGVRFGATELGYTLSGPGVLYRPSGWPIGSIEVDLTHGYATTPADLLPVLAARASRLVNPRDPDLASRAVGQVSESYRTTPGNATVDPVVSRYSVVGGIA